MTDNMHNGVLTWVPEHCGKVSASSASLEGAAAFDPADISYWLDKIGSMIPAFVLGGICLVGFIFMLTWIIVRICRRRQLEHAASSPEAQQFLTAGATASVAPLGPPRVARRRLAADVLAALVLLFGLATVGVGSWAMAESILQTDHKVSDFWVIIDEVQGILTDGISQSQNLSYYLNLLGPSAVAVAEQAVVLTPALTGLGLPGPVVQQVIMMGVQVPQPYLNDAAVKINETAVPVLQDLLQVVKDIQKFENASMSVQDKWRFIILAVLFGLLIVGVIGATALCFYMRFGRWASTAVAVMWFLTMLVMLGGVGLLYQAQVVSAEGCLYAESYAYKLADGLSNPTSRKVTREVLDYYFGVTNLTGIVENATEAATAAVEGVVNQAAEGILKPFAPDLAAALVDKVSTIDKDNMTLILTRANELRQELDSLARSDRQQLEELARSYGVPNATIEALQGFASAVIGVVDSAGNLLQALRRTSVVPTYHSFKSYLCCTIHGSAYNIWVSWIVCGSLALAYCLLATVRVVWQTFIPQDRGWLSRRELQPTTWKSKESEAGIPKMASDGLEAPAPHASQLSTPISAHRPAKDF